MNAPDVGTQEFEALRPRLFGIAYRMTGSVGDAEDACQDAWLRWQAVDRAQVDNPEAFLVRTVTRLAIDRLRSAHHRKETYVGPYLPEPLVVDDATETQPEVAAELADSLTLAFLVLLDELSPSSARCCCSTTCSGTRSTRWRRWSTRHRRHAGSWPAAPAEGCRTHNSSCAGPTPRRSRSWWARSWPRSPAATSNR